MKTIDTLLFESKFNLSLIYTVHTIYNDYIIIIVNGWIIEGFYDIIIIMVRTDAEMSVYTIYRVVLI